MWPIIDTLMYNKSILSLWKVNTYVLKPNFKKKTIYSKNSYRPTRLYHMYSDFSSFGISFCAFYQWVPVMTLLVHKQRKIGLQLLTQLPINLSSNFHESRMFTTTLCQFMNFHSIEDLIGFTIFSPSDKFHIYFLMKPGAHQIYMNSHLPFASIILYRRTCDCQNKSRGLWATNKILINGFSEELLNQS